MYAVALECLRGALWYGLARCELAEDSCIVDPKSTTNGAQLHDRLGVESGKGLQKTRSTAATKVARVGQQRRSGTLVRLEIERGSPLFSPLFVSAGSSSLSF